MAILSKEEVQALLKKVLAFSKQKNARLASPVLKEVTFVMPAMLFPPQGDISTLSLAVSSSFGKKTGATIIDEFDNKSLEKVVRRSEELAQLAPENPEHMPLSGPQTFPESITYVPATAAMTPESRAEAVAKSIDAAKEAKLEAAGFLENTTSFDSVLNSKGLFAYNKDTDVIFTITARNQAGTGSGYAAKGFNDVTKLDTLSATKAAAGKANGSAGAKAIEPGKYTVILEPVAATYMLENLFRGFDARSADEGRSFMSKAGGGNRIGEQLMDEKVTLYSDPFNPELPSETWNRRDFLTRKQTGLKKALLKI